MSIVAKQTSDAANQQSSAGPVKLRRLTDLAKITGTRQSKLNSTGIVQRTPDGKYSKEPTLGEYRANN